MDASVAMQTVLRYSCLAMDPFIPGSLEEQVAELRSRVLRLERLLQAYGAVERTEAPQPPQASAVEQAPATQASQLSALPDPAPAFTSHPIEPPQFVTAEPERHRDTMSMER